MKDRSTLVLIAAILLYSSVLLVTADAMSGASTAGACAGVICRVVRFIRDFQTLIAAGLAAGAAWYAGKPVWLQLQNMHAQHDIMARDTIVKRLEGIEERTKVADRESIGLLHAAWEEIYGRISDEEYDPKNITIVWADETERKARQLVSKLRHHQVSRSDTAAIEKARTSLIAQVKSFAECLASICAPERWAGDIDMTEEREQDLKRAAAEARLELPQVVDDLEKAKKEFAATSSSEIKAIKRRIREIDDSILSRPEPQ